MHVPADGTRWKAGHDGISSTLIAVMSMVRGLALYLSGRPRTPLRASCALWRSTRFTCFATGDDCQRSSSKCWRPCSISAPAPMRLSIKKRFAGESVVVTRQLLEEAGIGSFVAEYLRRLANLERSRPRPGGDGRQFQKVSLYREAVVRLSLGMVATVAGGNPCLDEAIEATYGDGELNLLFRIVMQCQIIDDVLDYSQDRSAGLPSFLTACQSLLLALELTQRAARGYAEDRHVARAANVFPLRAALFFVSMCAELVVVSSSLKFGATLGRSRTLARRGPRMFKTNSMKSPRPPGWPPR